MRERIRGVDRRDRSKRLDGLLVSTLTLEAQRELLEQRKRLFVEAHFAIELSQLGRDVAVAHRGLREMLRDHLANMLVDCNGLLREAVRREHLADGLERVDGLG